MVGGNITGLGEFWSDSGLEKYVVVKVSGLRRLLFWQREELGKVSPAMGGSGREVFTPSRAAFPGEAPFPFPESHVIYTHKKGTENNGWGSKQQLRVIFQWKENGEVTYLFSSHSEHIVCNRSFPIHCCILQYLLSFLFHMV